MSKTILKKWTALFCALLIAVQLLPVAASASATQPPAVSSNINQQDYDIWSKPVQSYLYTRDDGGLTRVEYIGGKVVVEDYDDGFNLIAGRSITPELPVWGGFFAGENANFLFFGQNNPDEINSVEVIRVVKYSKAWQRLGSASLYGANTKKPFDAGSLRADECGDYLYVRTCHEMYRTSDGYNHQSNMTFCVDTRNMTVTDSFCDIYSSAMGYVSHSFNQFLIVDQDSKLVTLDHGDSNSNIENTRGVAFMRYNAKASTGKFTNAVDQGRICSFCLIHSCPDGSGHYNDTGASIGGLAETSGAYIMAYNDNGTGSGTQDRIPYYHWMDKKTGESRAVELKSTMVPPGSSTPVLAPTGLNGGYMLWNEKNGSTANRNMHYLSYGADGKLEQPITVHDTVAPLSDCQPIPYKGGAVWYVTENSEPTFYIIDGNGVTAHAVGSGSVNPNPNPNPNPDPDPDPTPGSGLTPVEGVRDPRLEPTVKDAARMAAKLQTRFVQSSASSAIYIKKDGTYADFTDAVQVTYYQDYSYNGDAVFVLTKNGDVYISGDFSSVGLPDPYSNKFKRLTGNVRAIDAYDNANGLMVIDNDNNLWQYTASGRSAQPILTDVDSVVSGFYRCAALRRDGSVWFWGEDGFGSDDKVVGLYLHGKPRSVSELISKDQRIVSIGFDSENGWAIDENGGLWCWGSNEYGQIGNNGQYDILCNAGGQQVPGMEHPVKIIDSGVISAAPGMAVLKDGSVLRWKSTFGYYVSPYDTESLVPIKTPEQHMLAGDITVNDEGHLYFDFYDCYAASCMMDFMIPANRQAYTGADTEILSVTTDRNTGSDTVNATVNASSVPGEALEYGILFQDYRPSSEPAPIHWQTSNQFPRLKPGDHTFYVRVRGTFGQHPHAPGATHDSLSKPTPTPGPGLTPVEGVRDPRMETTVKDAARMAAKLKTRFVHSPGYTAHVGKDGTYYGISDVVQVTGYQAYSGNNYGAFCLTKNGEVYISGDLSSVGLSGTNSDAFVKLTDNARAISAYDTYGGLMVIDNDNNLWQYTSSGKSRQPILTDVDSVVSGFNRHAALKRDGSVWFWGEDGFGCDWKVLGVYLHDGPRSVSELISKDKHIVSIGFEDENGWAIDENGGLWCWGSNQDGQIGNNGEFDIRCADGGNIPGMENPVKIIESGVISAFPGMAVLKDGSVLRWRTASTYYLSPYDTESLVPVKTPEQRMLAGDLNVSDEGHLYNAVCMMNFMTPADRAAYTGSDTEILGVTTDRDTGCTTVNASPVTGEALEYGMAFREYDPSSEPAPIHWQTSNQFPGLEPGNYTFYVRIRGTFGDDPHGSGATHSCTYIVNDHTLVPVEGLDDPRMEPTVRDAARMAAKLRTRFQMPTTVGIVWTDKNNTLHHNLDTSTIPSTEKVVQVDSYEGDETVFALTESGKVWVKGNIGCVGLGGSSDAYSADFVELPLSGTVRYISADSDGLMIIYHKFDGLYHVFGIGGTPYLPFQTRISFLTSNVDSVVSGFNRHAALLRDGRVWFWGEDGFGCERKLAGVYLHGKPRQFSELLGKDKHIVSIGFDNENGWAIDDEGGLWCWGSNEYGQIGNGGRYDVSSNAAGHVVYGVEKPVKVIDRDVISAAPGMAVLKDGSVLRWGNEAGSLTPVPTGEQRMLAGPATVDEYGQLTYTNDLGQPVFIQNFIPADSRPEYTGEVPVIHSITMENGYTVVNASAGGQALEYGVAYGDHTLLSAGQQPLIRWQSSNRLLLKPGVHDIYVRVRGTFGSGAHASGTVLSTRHTVPGPFYIRVNGEYAYIYSTNGAPTGNEGLTAVLAGYEKDGKLVGTFTSPVRKHSFPGDTSWGNGFHISEWRNAATLRGFLLDSKTQAPRASAPALNLNVK